MRNEIWVLMLVTILASTAHAAPIMPPTNLSIGVQAKINIGNTITVPMPTQEVFRPNLNRTLDTNYWDTRNGTMVYNSDLNKETQGPEFYPSETFSMLGAVQMQARQSFMGQTENLNLKTAPIAMDKRGGGTTADDDGYSLAVLALEDTSVQMGPFPNKDVAGKDGFIDKNKLLGKVPVPAYA
jgi:hypothetical protein